MENNLSENFTLSKDQIRFIDDGVINNGKKLKDVVEELAKQDDNNFQKKDVEQIMESYREIKRQEQAIAKQFKGPRIWTQARLKKLKEEIKNKGKDINAVALAGDLKKTELFGFLNENLIIAKIFKLISELQKHEKIGLKQDKNKWTQEEIKIVEGAIKEEIKNKCKKINNHALAKQLKPKLEKHPYGSIVAKISELKNKLMGHEQTGSKRSNSRWTQEEIKIVEEAIKEEIKDKGENINYFYFS